MKGNDPFFLSRPRRRYASSLSDAATLPGGAGAGPATERLRSLCWSPRRRDPVLLFTSPRLSDLWEETSDGPPRTEPLPCAWAGKG